MPMTMIVLKNVPASLRGDLTRWMQEISTGVYVGNFNTRIRELLWQRVIATIGTGEAVLCFAARNELGYDFKTYNTVRKVIDFDGLSLVFIPKVLSDDHDDSLHSGFSKASQIHMARKASCKSGSKPEDYVVIDVETTGLDLSKCGIIEIGAVRCLSGEISYFQKLVQTDRKIPEKISKLTGITDALLKMEGYSLGKVLKEFQNFIGELPIVSYNAAFDSSFLNDAYRKEGMGQINNMFYDLMRAVKKEQMFQSDYRLETSLKSYGIDSEVPHRALEDAKLAYELAEKVKKF